LLHCLVTSTSNSSPRAFIIQSPAAILVLFTVSLVLHLPKSSESDFHANLKRVDFSGAICLVLAVFLLLFGLDRGGNVSWTDTLTISTLAASLFLSVLFAFTEVTLASEPFAPRRIILNRSLTASYLVNFFGMASALSLFFHVSLYIQAVHGKTATEAGLWLLPSIAGGVFGSVGGGLVIQSTGKYYFLTVGAYLTLLVGTVVVVLPTGAAMGSAAGVALGTLCLFIAKCVADGTQASSWRVSGTVSVCIAVVFNVVNSTIPTTGSGITTSLIDIIANAGPADQAIATAGKSIVCYLHSQK